MAQEVSIGITAVISIMIAIIIIASGYTAAANKIGVDSRTMVMNDAYSIYSILLEISSSEQGYAIYDRITESYNISLDENALVVRAETPQGIISYTLEHRIQNIVPAKVSETNTICIVKKIVNCKPQITICKGGDDACCNIGETIC